MKSHLRVSILIFSIICNIFFSLFAEEHSFYKLSIEDGLSSNSVYRIEQDTIGYMWFGTFSGLNRYDGTEIKTYKPEPGNRNSLGSPVIFDLFEDSRHRLWVATDGGGLNLYNRDKDNFTVFSHDLNNDQSISSNNVYALAEDKDNRLWIGTGGAGLNLYLEKSQTFLKYKSSEEFGTLDSDIIRVLYVDQSGTLWIGTEGGGLSQLNEDGSFTNFRYDSLSGDSISSDIVRSIFEDSRGTLWIGTEGGGLNRFDPSSGIFYHIENEFLKNRGAYSVRSIIEDKDGNIWVGTEGQGLFIISKNGEVLQNIRQSDGDAKSLSKDKIRHIFIDRNGLMWVGTRDGGVNRYNPRNIGVKLDSDRDIRVIFQDSHHDLWIGADGGGLIHSKNGSGIYRTYTLNSDPASLSSNQVYSITEDHDGNLWIGTDGGGLNRFNRDNESFTRFLYSSEDKRSINSNTVWSLLEDSKENLWIGTEGGGLNLYDSYSDSFRYFLSIPEDPGTLTGNSIRSIYEDSYNDLWIGTWDGGLNLYNYETEDFTRFSRNPDDIYSLSDSSVNTIFEDSSRRLWIGTAAGGLNLFDRESQSFTHYRTEDGMSGDNIFGILEDENGNLWISTDRGLTMFNPDSGDILNFGESDGLLGNEFSVNACTELSSGEMLFGGPKGINRFFPEKVAVNRKEPPVVITGISVMNEPVDQRFMSDEQLVLSHDQNILSISFAVLDFAAPERNRYSVILEGLQSQWTYLEGQNNIIYTSLPAGNYRFRVIGSDNNGIWNNSGSFVDIKVKPPWWETGIFYGAMTLVLIFIILIFIQMRLQRLKIKNKELRDYTIHIQDVREEERTSVAREVHDELGQSLSALKMELFRIDNREDYNREQFKESTTSMLELLNMSLDAVKDLSTRLRPKVLDNLSLEEAISWLINDFSNRSGITVEGNFKEKMDIDDSEIKTALFRICQEILTNIIRHAHADTVIISLKTNNHSVILDIHDNGCGISEDSLEKQRSFGIRGMKERCRYLNGQFLIQNAEDGGTTIKVVIPLRKGGDNA